jgi:hypothetical protein
MGGYRMKSNQYRVWDTGHEAFIDHILIAQDGTILLNLGDRLVPSLEPERYIVEFATGYLDTKDVMIYDGDIVSREDAATNYRIVWGEFSDCCVNGDAWMLEPQDYEPAMGYWCNNDEAEYRSLTIIGNIHQTPELISLEEQSA